MYSSAYRNSRPAATYAKDKAPGAFRCNIALSSTRGAKRRTIPWSSTRLEYPTPTVPSEIFRASASFGRAPLNVALLLLVAKNVSRLIGSWMTSHSVTPSRTTATTTVQAGVPLIRLVVPSIRSMTQVNREVPETGACSSPTIASSDKALANRSRVSHSTLRSACEARSCCPFGLITSVSCSRKYLRAKTSGLFENFLQGFNSLGHARSSRGRKLVLFKLRAA